MSERPAVPPLATEESGATLYEILEVAPTATTDAIRRGYKKQAARWHPDRHPDGPAKATATIAFQRVAEAYEILSNDRLRQVYDVHGLDAVRHGGGEMREDSDDAAAASEPWRQWGHHHRNNNNGRRRDPFHAFAALDPFEVFRMAFGCDFDVSMFSGAPRAGDPFGFDDDSDEFEGMERFFLFPQMSRQHQHHHRDGVGGDARSTMQQRSTVTEIRGNQRFVRTVTVDSDPVTGKRRETTSSYVEDLATGQRQALPEPLNQHSVDDHEPNRQRPTIVGHGDGTAMAHSNGGGGVVGPHHCTAPREGGGGLASSSKSTVEGKDHHRRHNDGKSDYHRVSPPPAEHHAAAAPVHSTQHQRRSDDIRPPLGGQGAPKKRPSSRCCCCTIS